MEENSAIFAKATYELDSSGDKEERLEKAQRFIDKNLPKGGWRLVPEHSNRHILTAVNDKEVHISHKGTNVTKASDLKADVSIALGQKQKDNTFKMRTTKTLNALKAFPDKIATASGHSLGGATIHHAALSNRYVADRLNKIDTYNQGVSVFKGRVLKSREKDLENKITLHRTKGDPVSAMMLINKPVGKVKTYKTTHEGSPTTKLLTSALKVGLAKDSLDSHTIDNFIE